jgi:type II secretory pathway predicted ATPase ExeA/Mrp family chromosome partitioning ATPase
MAAIATVAPSVHSLLDFFGLLEQPFAVTPDPAYLYLGSGHDRALRALSAGIRADRGFLALIAEPGMGKTTLLNRLREDLSDSARVVSLNWVSTPKEWDVAMHRQLNQILYEQTLAGKRFVLMVDDPQNLCDPVLEGFRMLCNFETPHAKLLQIVLAGQPGLAAKLGQFSFTQLRQGVTFINELSRMSLFETAQYIDFRLSVAGSRKNELFTNDALVEIGIASQGIPRNINSVCFAAMSLAFHRWQRTIGRELIREVAAQRNLEIVPRQTAIPRATTPACKVAPAVDLRLSHRQPRRFSLFRGFFRKAPNPKENSSFHNCYQIDNLNVSSKVVGQIPLDVRSVAMANTGVARASTPSSSTGHLLVKLESPLAIYGKRAQKENLFVPNEDSLRLAARLFASSSETDRVFLFAGVTGPEGVADVSAGVAIGLAQVAKGRVLLVDADLRAPSLHSRFGASLSPGLSDLARGTTDGSAFPSLAAGEVTLLAAGEKIDPLSLFSSQAFSEFLAKAREKYRFIVLKAPAILSFGEVDMLVRSADGVVMVVPNRKQRKSTVAEGRRALADLKAKVLGAVLCNEEPKRTNREG